MSERLSKRWRQVHEADTDTTPVLRLVENRFEELVRKAEFTFFPGEAGQERTFADLSDGQRSFISRLRQRLWRSKRTFSRNL